MTDGTDSAATGTALAEAKKKAPLVIETGKRIAGLVPTNQTECVALAKALSQSGDMVPKHYDGKPEATLAAIMFGLEVGLPPMAALRGIALINGSPCIWGDALKGLIYRHGHDFDVVLEGEGDDMVATCTLTRGDSGRTKTGRFSMKQAKRAGLLDKKGKDGKVLTNTPWHTYPEDMLGNRAISRAVKLGCPEVLSGLATRDEIEDAQVSRMKDVTPPEDDADGEDEGKPKGIFDE